MGGGPPASWGNFIAWALIGGVICLLVFLPIACALK